MDGGGNATHTGALHNFCIGVPVDVSPGSDRASCSRLRADYDERATATATPASHTTDDDPYSPRSVSPLSTPRLNPSATSPSAAPAFTLPGAVGEVDALGRRRRGGEVASSVASLTQVGLLDNHARDDEPPPRLQ